MSIKHTFSTEEAFTFILKEASRGLCRVSPNPPVGALIVDQKGSFLSKGFHVAYGEEHAEVVALKKIKDPSLLKNATLYVTLEPCSFEGQTPSCAKTLSKLPLKKVCIGLKDPNPKVNGQGIEILQQAGIEVELYRGHLKQELEELIEVFSHNVLNKKPFVALKMACSLDGKTVSSASQWITGQASREYVQEIRAQYDSVCIGVNTLLKDNPRLNPRPKNLSIQVNKVIILDPEGQSESFLKKSKLLQVRNPSDVTIVSGRKINLNNGIKLLLQETDENGLFDLNKLLSSLFQEGIHSILVEGGMKTFSYFIPSIQNPLAQRLYLFISPHILGKEGSLPLESLNRVTLLHERKQCFGSDVMLTGRINVLTNGGLSLWSFFDNKTLQHLK